MSMAKGAPHGCRIASFGSSSWLQDSKLWYSRVDLVAERVMLQTALNITARCGHREQEGTTARVAIYQTGECNAASFMPCTLAC